MYIPMSVIVVSMLVGASEPFAVLVVVVSLMQRDSRGCTMYVRRMMKAWEKKEEKTFDNATSTEYTMMTTPPPPPSPVFGLYGLNIYTLLM